MKDSYSYSLGPHDQRVLPIGAFIQPIAYCYVPKHIKEDPQWYYYSLEDYTFVYSQHGYVLIPKKLIREIL